MSSSMADKIIREAIERGDFDDLPTKGRGKRMNLEADAGVPSELRLSQRVLKNAGYTPEEIQLKKQLEELDTNLKAVQSDEERQALHKLKNEKLLRFSMLMERNGFNPIQFEYAEQIRKKLDA